MCHAEAVLLFRKAFHATAVSPNYGISKWAVMSLSKSEYKQIVFLRGRADQLSTTARTLAVTYGKHDIRINGVAPG